MKRKRATLKLKSGKLSPDKKQKEPWRKKGIYTRWIYTRIPSEQTANKKRPDAPYGLEFSNRLPGNRGVVMTPRLEPRKRKTRRKKK
ncbi:MAG: hypothetical protein VW907_09695 [Opitutae bacterium]